MGFFSNIARALFGGPKHAQDPEDIMLVEFPKVDPDKLPDASEFPAEKKGQRIRLADDQVMSGGGAVTLWPPDAAPGKGLSAQLPFIVDRVGDPSTDDWTQDALNGFTNWKMFSALKENPKNGSREVFAIVRAMIDGNTPSHIAFYRFSGAAATLFRRSFSLPGPLHLNDAKFFSFDGTLAVHHLVTRCNEHIFDKERLRDFEPQFKMRSLAEIDGVFYSMFYHNSDGEALLTDAGDDFLLSFQLSSTR